MTMPMQLGLLVRLAIGSGTPTVIMAGERGLARLGPAAFLTVVGSTVALGLVYARVTRDTLALMAIWAVLLAVDVVVIAADMHTRVTMPRVITLIVGWLAGVALMYPAIRGGAK